MKKIVLITIVFVLSIYAASFAGIIGSPHDFSGSAENHINEGEICKACHVPHNAVSGSVPLWRWSLSAYGIPASFKLYSSDTLDATVSQPLAPSKACLTCHDGSIATQPVTGCTSCHTMHGASSDLSDDHPVSFTYDTALAQKDGTLLDPNVTTVPSLGGKTIREGMLYQGRLECTSCHDVHATKGDSKSTRKLLLVNNNNSSLCLTCHNK